MPNWVKNKVKFGNKQIMKDIYYQDDNENEYFDFNRIIEMPKSLELTSGGKEDISIHYAISKMSEQEKENTIKMLNEKQCDFYGNYYNKIFRHKDKYTDEEYQKASDELDSVINGDKNEFLENIDYKGLGIHNLEELGKAYLNNIKEYGADTWYDWHCENWGTKWNSTNVYYINENEVEFDTAWSMPYRLLEKLSEIYETRIEVRYADEDIGNNCGEIIFENGNCVDMYERDDMFAYELWGYTQEEIDEIKAEYED